MSVACCVWVGGGNFPGVSWPAGKPSSYTVPQRRLASCGPTAEGASVSTPFTQHLIFLLLTGKKNRKRGIKRENNLESAEGEGR